MKTQLKGRKAALVCWLLAGLMLFATSAVAKEIAVLLPAAGAPYFKMKSYGYLDEAKKLGVTVNIYDAGGYGNLNKQITQLEDVIQRKVSAIVLVPASSTGTVPAVEKAIAAGIPVINDGIATASPKVTGFVGEDSYVMGELQALHIADKLKGEGKVVMLLGPAGLDLTNFRKDGFKDYLSRFPKMKIVAEKYMDTTAAEALKAMEDFLQANPDIKGVYTFNGPLVVGAVQALRARGAKPGDVIVTSLDLEEEADRLIRQGWLSMTVVSEPITMARLAIRRAVEASEGKKIPKESLTQETMVTKDTIDTVDLTGQWVPKDWGK